MKKIFLTIFILLFSSVVFAYSDDFSKENLKKLSLIERNIFGRVSKNTDYNERLNSAEKRVFGSVQSGDIESRINFLGTVVESSRQGYSNYVSVPNYVINPIGIIRNAIVQRQGVLTGFTPPPPPPPANYYNNNLYYNGNVPPMYHRNNINGNNTFNNRLIRNY